MKESSSSPWFATRLLNAASTTSRPRSEKQTPPIGVGSSCTPFSLNTPSFSSSFSCQFGSPATSPSPFRSVVVIPFSWEKQPGVPKHAHHLHHPKDEHRVPSYPKLPLPPPIRSNSDPFLSAPRRKKRHDPAPTADPFVLAILECSREEEDRRDPAENEEPVGGLYWKGSPAGMSKVAGGRRRAAADRFGFVGRYGSCKTTCSVADSAVRIPRSGR